MAELWGKLALNRKILSQKRSELCGRTMSMLFCWTEFHFVEKNMWKLRVENKGMPLMSLQYDFWECGFQSFANFAAN